MIKTFSFKSTLGHTVAGSGNLNYESSPAVGQGGGGSKIVTLPASQGPVSIAVNACESIMMRLSMDLVGQIIIAQRPFKTQESKVQGDSEMGDLYLFTPQESTRPCLY
jgi:hypothetical protein